jgi:hypothetical protein
MKASPGIVGFFFAMAMSSCGKEEVAAVGSEDGSLDLGVDSDAADSGALVDSGPDEDSDGEAGPMDCPYGDYGSQFDAGSHFQGSCSGGCPAGTICATELGGVGPTPPFSAGAYCAPIPDRCKSNPTCGCLASCVCGQSYGRPEICYDQTDPDGGKTIGCDNGFR